MKRAAILQSGRVLSESDFDIIIARPLLLLGERECRNSRQS